VLGGDAPVDASALSAAKVVAIAAHEGPLTRIASVVLPATSWAEHSGMYVNAKGLRQTAERALHPLGASRPAYEQIADLAVALGYARPASKLSQVRAQLAGGAGTDPASRRGSAVVV
jgi:anaerobic selenocysteine-containing dehydrogenase